MNSTAIAVLLTFALIGFAAGMTYEQTKAERLELLRELDALRARLPAAAAAPEIAQQVAEVAS